MSSNDVTDKDYVKKVNVLTGSEEEFLAYARGSIGYNVIKKEPEIELKNLQAENEELRDGLHKVILEHYRPKSEKEPDWSEIEYWQDYLEELGEKK